MKLDIVVLSIKGLCLTAIPTLTALKAGGTWIDASIAACGGLLAFLSTSFGTYLQSRTNGNGVDKSVLSKQP